MSLDPDTLAFLRAVFEEACSLLPPHKRTHEMRSALAVDILKQAAKGERNQGRLRLYALSLTEVDGPQSARPTRQRGVNGPRVEAVVDRNIAGERVED
jgi:hypothetical protein